MTKKPVLKYYQVSYSFRHKSGRVAAYSLTVPAENAEDARVKAADRMQREGTPMERVEIINAGPAIRMQS